LEITATASLFFECPTRPHLRYKAIGDNSNSNSSIIFQNNSSVIINFQRNAAVIVSQRQCTTSVSSIPFIFKIQHHQHHFLFGEVLVKLYHSILPPLRIDQRTLCKILSGKQEGATYKPR